MKFEKLIEEFSGSPFFEFKEIRQISTDSETQLKNQLSQWTKQGKLERLRRGKYLLGSQYRKFTPSTYYISNYLYRPSYVSLETALQYYDIIPEAVAPVLAVTPKHGRQWANALGRFEYRSIKQDHFWGYRENTIKNIPTQNRFFIAEPEKAILDLIYFRNGEWTRERISETRFQSFQNLDQKKLHKYATRFDSPRIERAVKRFIDLYEKELRK